MGNGRKRLHVHCTYQKEHERKLTRILSVEHSRLNEKLSLHNVRLQ